MEQRKVNLATAKVVPVFLALIVAYISYTITGPLAVDYLLNPPKKEDAQVGAGISIAIVYYVLLLPVAATYIRLLHVMWSDPGYVPLGQPTLPNGKSAFGMEEFWTREVFVCDERGMPIWCFHCNNWKPDRTHHGQDAGRCTRKMDHFCPWVGGVVGERSLKFFIQFNFYSFLLSAYTMSVLAFFVAEKRERSSPSVQWIIALGLSAFFCLFTAGIFGNSMWMASRNVTSIENVNAHSQTVLLAVLLPPELQGEKISDSPSPPLPAHLSPKTSGSQALDSARPMSSDLKDSRPASQFLNVQGSRPPRRSSVLPYQDRIWRGTVTYPLLLQTDRPPLPAPAPKTFAILETLPGMNPWHLGSGFQNLQAVLGRALHEWLLPVKHSPCCDHSSLISQFPLGPDFEELLIEAGLAPRPLSSSPLKPLPIGATSSSTSRNRRRKKPRLDPGWQDGERPDGWLSEKEARRLRNEARRGTRDGLG